MKMNTKIVNITYKGANPDNYIIFNDEIWRIISINADGTIKIIKSQSNGKKFMMLLVVDMVIIIGIDHQI